MYSRCMFHDFSLIGLRIPAPGQADPDYADIRRGRLNDSSMTE